VIIGFAALAVLAAGFFLFHTLYVKTSRMVLVCESAPPFRLVHISDLHGRTLFLNGRLSWLVNRHSPDLVCITGDLANNRKQLAEVIKEAGRIRSTYGLFFVPGNYEREEVRLFRKRPISTEAYRENMAAVGTAMTVLQNDSRCIGIGGRRVLLYGFDNSVYGNEAYTLDVGSLNPDYTILLAHSPNIYSLIDRLALPFHLLLTGHTHGGQIRLFDRTIGRYRHFHVGVKQTGPDRHFAISRGLGTVKLPIRLNCFPEISVYDIRNE
jgi:predicted MPP superfamily phosphohydrolase